MERYRVSSRQQQQHNLYIPAAAQVFKSHDFPVFIHFLFVFPIIYTQLKSSQRRRLTHSSLCASWYFQIELDRHLTRAFTSSCAASGNNKRRKIQKTLRINALLAASKWQKPVRRSLARRCRPRIISKP